MFKVNNRNTRTRCEICSKLTIIAGFHSPFRFDHNRNSGGIMLYLRKDIPAKLLSVDFPSVESLFIEINLYKKKWLINCSYNSHKSNIGKNFDIITRSLNILSTKYGSIVLLGDFNAYVDDEILQTVCKSCSLDSLIKQPTCFKNLENPSCIDLFFTNKPRSRCVLKIHLCKVAPNVINYRDF